MPTNSESALCWGDREFSRTIEAFIRIPHWSANGFLFGDPRKSSVSSYQLTSSTVGFIVVG